MKYHRVTISIFAMIVLLYMGPLSSQFAEWLGASRIYMVAIIGLGIASERNLLGRIVFMGLLVITSLLLATSLGENGTIADGGVWGDWLLFKVLPVYADYVQGLGGLTGGCLFTMMLSIMALSDKK